MSDSTSSSLDLINLLHNLKRCTALVESAFPANHEDNQVKRERFWKDFISTKEDPMGNLDLLKGYLEIESRIQEWVLVENTCAYSETLDSSNVEQNAHEYFSLNGDKHDNEDSLFYELALDERTRPICDVYGMMSNLMLQLELAVLECKASHSKSTLAPSCYPDGSVQQQSAAIAEIRSLCHQGIRFTCSYLNSRWSVLLPERRKALRWRLHSVVSMLPGEALQDVTSTTLDKESQKIEVNSRGQESVSSLVSLWLSKLQMSNQSGSGPERLDGTPAVTAVSPVERCLSTVSGKVEGVINSASQEGDQPPNVYDENISSTATISEVENCRHSFEDLTTPESLYHLTPSPWVQPDIDSTLVIPMPPIPLSHDHYFTDELNREDRKKNFEDSHVDPIKLAAIEEELYGHLGSESDEEEEGEEGSDAYLHTSAYKGDSEMRHNERSILEQCPSITEQSSMHNTKSVTFRSAAPAAGNSDASSSYPRSAEAVFQSRRRPPRPSCLESMGGEKEEQESLTAFIGEAVNHLRDLAHQSRAIIAKDNQRLEATTAIQDNYLHDTKRGEDVARQLRWTSSFSFLQEVIMLTFAGGLFILTLSLIASTVLVA